MYLEAIKASILGHVRPTTTILGADNRKRWSRMDILLINAYQRYLDEMCPVHGGPRWLCDSAEQSLRIRVRESRCEAKRELEIREEARKDDDNKGISLIPEFYSADGRELVEYRDLYRERKRRDAAEDNDE